MAWGNKHNARLQRDDEERIKEFKIFVDKVLKFIKRVFKR